MPATDRRWRAPWLRRRDVGGGVGWPVFVAIANGPAGGRLIPPDAAELERIMARYPFLKPVTLSSGAYRGQEQDVRTVGSWAHVLARASLPDDVAYRLAKALHGSQPALGQRLAQARESTLAKTAPQPRRVGPDPSRRSALHPRGGSGPGGPVHLVIATLAARKAAA